MERKAKEMTERSSQESNKAFDVQSEPRRTAYARSRSSVSELVGNISTARHHVLGRAERARHGNDQTLDRQGTHLRNVARNSRLRSQVLAFKDECYG